VETPSPNSSSRHDQPLPVNTWTVRTSSGGWHFYYQQPANTSLGNTAGRLGTGIDTRGTGGYVLGAGSLINNTPYTVVHRAPILPLPDWLCDLLTTAPNLPKNPHETARMLTQLQTGDRYMDAALQGEAERVLAARVGSRNHTLNKAAFALGRLVAAGRLDETLVLSVLTQTGQNIGLSERKCAVTIRSGLQAHTKQSQGRTA